MDRLTPLIAVGPDFPPGLFTSPTTRRTGLVANIDFAPTVLSLFHVQPPRVMTGRPMSAKTSGNAEGDAAGRIAVVKRLDFVSGLNESAETAILLPLGVLCFLIVAGGLMMKRFGARGARWFGAGFVFALNLPAAMLLAPIHVPPTLLEYCLRVVVWSAALTLACYIAQYIWRISPVVSAMASGVAILTGDTLTGQLLQKDSAFCGYAITGIPLAMALATNTSAF